MNTTSLPAGATCGTCHFFATCRARFHRLPEDRECEHAPALYRRAAPVVNQHGAAPRPAPGKSAATPRKRRRHLREDEPEKVKLLERKRTPGRFRFGSGAYQMVLALEGFS